MRALDLFCGAGGATRGLQMAGFHVTGVDINPQPRYCGDAFIQGDALTVDLDGYDLIWASPPCQAFSVASVVHGPGSRERHPDLIDPVRQRLINSGSVWVIENVPQAPLRNPVMLCGVMFPGLKVYRHRLFETSFMALQPGHQRHLERLPRAGRGANANGWLSICGHFPDVGAGRTAMGIDWMTRDELSQAIPPAYAYWLGIVAMAHIRQVAA